MENSETEYAVQLKYYIQDYWDIVVGIIVVIAAIMMHQGGNGIMATMFAAIGIAALSLLRSLRLPKSFPKD
ncbi:MAG: hypothetical protein PHO65_06495 [Sulfurovum sp.]|nr:hypothetical protein [Sulfurovum sp.]